jgi:hypothetical protein
MNVKLYNTDIAKKAFEHFVIAEICRLATVTGTVPIHVHGVIRKCRLAVGKEQAE